MKETEIAASVVQWLEEEGWTVYQEVSYEGRIADIVATRGPETWIVECKATRARTVIDQARHGLGQANSVWVAVPDTRVGYCANWDGRIYSNGLGEFTVDKAGVVQIRHSPKHRQVQDLGIRSVLTEHHKTFAEAGNAEGKRWSPFQALSQALQKAVQETPGLRLSDFMEENGHHYGSDEAAVGELKRLIRKGAVPGLVVKQGGKVFPEGYDRHSVKASS